MCQQPTGKWWSFNVSLSESSIRPFWPWYYHDYITLVTTPMSKIASKPIQQSQLLNTFPKCLVFLFSPWSNPALTVFPTPLQMFNILVRHMMTCKDCTGCHDMLRGTRGKHNASMQKTRWVIIRWDAGACGMIMNKRDGFQMSNKQIKIWAYLLTLIGPSLLLSNRCNQLDRSSMRITTLNKRPRQCDKSLVFH